MKRERIRFFLLTALVMCTMLTACNDQQSSTAGDNETPKESIQEEASPTTNPLTEEAKNLILDCLKKNHDYARVYFAGDEVGEAQTGDERIDEITYVGEAATGQTTGVGFQVNASIFGKWNDEAAAPSWEPCESTMLVVLGRNSRGQYEDARGISYSDSDDNLSRSILEISYHLYDLDVALWRDGFDNPVGPGSDISVFTDDRDGKPEIKRLEDWAPNYNPDGYWSRLSWKGFTAVCYNIDGRRQVQTAAVTRSDLHTAKGIHVGSTRAEVKKAHPNLFSTSSPFNEGPDFPSSDYLWYCASPEGYGTAIFFFFEKDIVCKILMLNFMD